ncbi:hypothetical protein [Streptomyces sp. NPDC054958]
MSPLTRSQREEARALAVVRLHVAACSPGPLIEAAAGLQRTARTLAATLKLPVAHVSAALTALDTLGVVAVRWRSVQVLGPDQPHPADVALQDTIRARARSGYYRLGSALPTGFLGEEFAMTSLEVARACRYLTGDVTLTRDPHGPYGPGFYVTLAGTRAYWLNALRAGRRGTA